MNAIIVYTANEFFKAYRSLAKDTWLIWVDKSLSIDSNRKEE